MAGNRTWLAVLLAVLFPGMGHAYLRTYGRALLWAGLFVSAVVLLFPEPSSSAGVLEGSRQMIREASTEANLSVSLLVIMNAVDAGLLASRRSAAESAEEGAVEGSCPECGKDLDDDLDFCPWCTARLDGASDDD